MSVILNEFVNHLRISLLKKTIQELSVEHEITIDKGKAQVSNFYRKLVTILFTSRPHLFNLSDITIKVLSVDEKNKPRETINYRSISLVDFISQNHNQIRSSSSFKDMFLPHIIMIYQRPLNFTEMPIQEKMNSTRLKEIKLWKPSKAEIEMFNSDFTEIEKVCKEVVKTAISFQKNRMVVVNNLPNQKESCYFHLRPKGRNQETYDKEYYEIYEVKVAQFAPYLNKRIVQHSICQVK